VIFASTLSLARSRCVAGILLIIGAFTNPHFIHPNVRFKQVHIWISGAKKFVINNMTIPVPATAISSLRAILVTSAVETIIVPSATKVDGMTLIPAVV
jgi:hypothetical protein